MAYISNGGVIFGSSVDICVWVDDTGKGRPLGVEQDDATDSWL